MNHAENPMSDNVNHHRSFEVLTAETAAVSTQAASSVERNVDARLAPPNFDPHHSTLVRSGSVGRPTERLFQHLREAILSGVFFN
jgi:hypothetical protein